MSDTSLPCVSLTNTLFAPQVLSSLIKKLENKILIGGELVTSLSENSFEVKCPATMQVLCQVPHCNVEDVNQAVYAAQEAQYAWSQIIPYDRGQLLYKCADLVEKHAEEIAQLMSWETGKAIRTESRIEMAVFCKTLRFYAGLGVELKGETIPFSNSSYVLTIREPIGVIGAIIPWNVPAMLMALKIAPALVAGNTAVVKSAEEAPLAVLRIAELMNQILPKGVLNLISGEGPTTGAALVAHPGIQKLTFTGSVETGRIVYTASAQRLIPVTLELGGKSPMIVCEDIDVDKAVQGALVGMRFTRQGQSCSASSRIFIHEKIFDIFLEKLKAKINQLTLGDPLAESTDTGSIISKEQYSKILKYLNIAKNTSGVILHECGQLPKDAHLKSGFYIQPTLLTGVKNDQLFCQEEIFGPVACLLSWNDFDTVLQQANSTEYGLAATIWTKDISRALQATKRLNAGFVQVNQNWVVQPGLPYGGFKNSGIGKEASLEAMLEHFTKKKTVMLNMEY